MLKLREVKKGAACLLAAMSLVCLTPKAEAAVLVYDAQNVEQAIRTAITTANILSNEEKQLLLQILNMKKLDASILTKYLDKMIALERYPLDERDGQLGVLSPKSTTDSFWQKNFRNIEAVINGKMTVMDAYYAGQAAYKAEADTNNDTVKNARLTQDLVEDLSQQAITALEASHNAEGNLQAVQAGNQVMGVGVMSLIQGNNLLSSMTAAQAVKNQRELQEEVTAKRINESTAEKLAKATQNCGLTAMSYEEFRQKMGEY